MCIMASSYVIHAGSVCIGCAPIVGCVKGYGRADGLTTVVWRRMTSWMNGYVATGKMSFPFSH